MLGVCNFVKIYRCCKCLIIRVLETGGGVKCLCISELIRFWRITVYALTLCF